MLFQITMLDVPRDEPRIADVIAGSEAEARMKVRRQYPAHAFKILFVHTIGNPEAVSMWPLQRTGKPKQAELAI